MKKLSLILVCAAILGLGAVGMAEAFYPAAGDTFPPAGQDEFNSSATLSIQLQGIIVENVQFSGPTVIQRQDPQGPPPRTIETEIVDLQLTSGSTALGVITVTLNPDIPSVGQITANQTETDFPADSYFDVYAQMTTTLYGGPYHTIDPLRMEGLNLTDLPPYGVIYGPHKPATWVPLYDEQDELVGYLFHVTHEVAITLNHFTVYTVDQVVMIEWTTGTEMDNAGFNLYRSGKEDEGYVKINGELIPAEGDATAGAGYSFTDAAVIPGATYYYKLESLASDERTDVYGPVMVKVPAGVSVPTDFYLVQNYPNPFNPRTTIEFALPEKAHVTLTIYNSLGQQVKELMNQEWPAGRYQTYWDGKGIYGEVLPSGVYFCKISAGNWTSTKKMMLLK
ncbi:MAG: DUF6073 family protein [bacterium]